MALLDKLAAAAIHAFVGELAATRQVLQQGIDTYRVANGMPTLYSEDPNGLIVDQPADPKAPKPIVGHGDMLTMDILVELAREQGVRWNDLEGLEQAARDRGWVDPDGKLLMLPQSYAGQMLGDLSVLP